MVFSAENGILINVSKQEKGHGAKKVIGKFPNKQWALSGIKGTALLRHHFLTGQHARNPRHYHLSSEGHQQP